MKYKDLPLRFNPKTKKRHKSKIICQEDISDFTLTFIKYFILKYGIFPYGKYIKCFEINVYI
jgi:hypothetical protein